MQLSQAEISFNFEGNQLLITLSNNKGEYLTIELNDNTFTIDRTKSGITDFSEKFAESAQTMPVEEQVTDFRIILDRASVEILLNKGKYSMTNIFFPNEAFSNLKLESNNDSKITNMTINHVKKTW